MSAGFAVLLIADMILLNGTIHTLDPSRPAAAAVASRDGRIIYVGDTEGAIGLKGPGTEVIDLQGATVVPGLVDAHGHIAGLGFALERLDLVGTRSAEEIATMVREKASGLPPGTWIRGRGWDQNDWQDTAFPTRAVLDAAAPDHPVVLDRIDGHAIWVNSRALAIAKVTRKTPAPPGGQIVRDEAGELTGIFVDAAESLIQSAIPPPGRAEIRAAIERGMRRSQQAGLTGVHDAGVDATALEVYRELLVSSDFPFRIYAMLSNDPGLLEARLAAGPEIGLGEGRLTVRAVKLYIDGALGSRGAALLAPYADDSGNTGLLQIEPDRLEALVLRAAKRGFQPCVHAIGDRGNRIALDAMQRALEALPGRDLRPRVEHAQTLAPDDISRFSRLGIIASMQPTHATSDLPWAGRRLGPERLKGAYAWRRLLASGARIACGSDFPVESERPLLGLYAAISRRGLDGTPEEGWSPDQRMTREEALACFTREAAWASFQEKDLGTLETGKYADMTVLSKDLMTVPVSEIPNIDVVMTIVGGRVAYRRP